MTHLDFEITILSAVLVLIVYTASSTIIRLENELDVLRKQIKEIKDNIYIIGGEEDDT